MPGKGTVGAGKVKIPSMTAGSKVAGEDCKPKVGHFVATKLDCCGKDYSL